MLLGHLFWANVTSAGSLFLGNITKEQVLMQDNEDALEPIRL